MSSIAHIDTLISRLAEHTGLTEGTLATRYLDKGDGLKRLREGKDIGVLRADRVIGAISQNWPADLAWPSDIPRPAAGSPVFAHGNGNAAVAAPDAGEAA